MKLTVLMLCSILLLSLCGCGVKPVTVPTDQRAAWKYAPPPSRELSLSGYSRIIIEEFTVHPSVSDREPALLFPQMIHNKLSFFYPNAFEDIHLGAYDRPGVVVSGWIIEYNPVQRVKRLLPSGRGTAIFGVEVVLNDNLSHRELARFSLRYPDEGVEFNAEEVLDASAKEIAAYLAYSRGR